MIPCPRCTAKPRGLNQRTHRGVVYRAFTCEQCRLNFHTHETIVRNRALELQLTADELERAFGKPKFKYKSTPPK